ncbi:hypothetical protein FA95DRAFT_1124271 [Auriscalpium vulgare]|uniref:Uncharacterized protein n=1 Tax=Auriscalpium vulgare TaxID=40419 RepID=A0ACB8RWU7_9AGAM|nr:hypothetical protein FA95DRAFT_1124271 [Auriscalpium vulgare]
MNRKHDDEQYWRCSCTVHLHSESAPERPAASSGTSSCDDHGVPAHHIFLLIYLKRCSATTIQPSIPRHTISHQHAPRRSTIALNILGRLSCPALSLPSCQKDLEEPSSAPDHTAHAAAHGTAPFVAAPPNVVCVQGMSDVLDDCPVWVVLVASSPG